MAHWKEFDRAFPDQQIEIVKLHNSDDAVLMEAIARGTHTGPFRGLPPTGRSFEQQFLAIFVFEGDALVCERVYYDTATVLQQLGIARDATSLTGRLETAASHPLTISRGLVRARDRAGSDGAAQSTAQAKKREEIVREHMDSENRHEFDATLETFDHPRYELIATGEVHDGPEEVMALLRGDAPRLPRPAQRAAGAPPRR